MTVVYLTMTLPDTSIDLLTDGHVHSRLCHHATGELEEYVQAAVDKGLHTIVFLEHMETGIDYFEPTWLSDSDFLYYMEEGQRLREIYAGKISVKLGVELGYNRECPDKVLARVSAHSWDRIGISCHFLRTAGTQQHINLLSRKEPNISLAGKVGLEHLLDSYFDSLIEAVRLLPGDVLCHLDAALRHIKGLVYSENNMAQIDELFTVMKTKEMALEVNCSGLKIRGEPFPSRSILAMAIDHGLPLVAGSDAHHPEDVGKGFEHLPAYINSAVCP